jgi:hypothetical protein
MMFSLAMHGPLDWNLPAAIYHSMSRGKARQENFSMTPTGNYFFRLSLTSYLATAVTAHAYCASLTLVVLLPVVLMLV